MYYREWYEGLDSLYAFEKVSVLYAILKNGDTKVTKEFERLELVEELLEILKAKIEIAYDDIIVEAVDVAIEELKQKLTRVSVVL